MGVTVTREQLQSIEWAGVDSEWPSCPACGQLEGGQHFNDCWLAAALAAPPPDETRADPRCSCGHRMFEHFQGPSNNGDMACNIAGCWCEDYRKAAQAPPPDPPGLREALEKVLAERVGNELCDDCGGTLIAWDQRSENVDDIVQIPCPDCIPREPERHKVERRLLLAVLAALPATDPQEAR
jgi:hypothetical protein